MNIELARSLASQLTDLSAQLNRSLEPDAVVQPGENLQAVLDAAEPGDTVRLVSGAAYTTGVLKLNPKSATVTLTTTDIGKATLSSGTLDKTIDGIGAANWRLDNLAFTGRSDGLGEIIVLHDAENIVLDKLQITGGVNGQKRAIRGNGKNITLSNSVITNIWRTGQDSQCFCAWDGAGPYAIVNNYLEGASENVMFGGADSQSVDRIPADILIEGNTFTKNLAWKGVPNTYAVKNLLEFKVGKRVIVRNNTFSNNWTDAQNGYAILLKSVNQGYDLSHGLIGAPWSVLEDVEIYNNAITGVENGFNILGISSDQPGGQTTRVSIHDNNVTCDRTAVQLGGKAGVVSISNNVFNHGGNLLTLYGTYSAENLTFTNNSYKNVPYGIKGDGTGSGLPSLTKYCLQYVYEGNFVG